MTRSLAVSFFALVALVATVPRARASAPAGRYVVSAGTVYDTRTKLTWQQTAPTAKTDWATAQNYCSSLNLNGTGWRMPTVKELLTLVDLSLTPMKGPAVIDATAFPGTSPDYFWSSTRALNLTDPSYWVVIFNSGMTAAAPRNGPCPVRCVR